LEKGTFDSGLFGQALSTALAPGASIYSQVNVPQFLGQGKLYYLLPHRFDAGLLLYYGRYRDSTRPDLNGILRSYTIYFARSWQIALS
jgi:hypothetical protein